VKVRGLSYLEPAFRAGSSFQRIFGGLCVFYIRFRVSQHPNRAVRPPSKATRPCVIRCVGL